MTDAALPAPALPVWINRGEPYWPLDIAVVERRRNAAYMGDFCLRDRLGCWTEQPCAVFWNETPPDPAYSQYFGLHVRHGTVFIVGTGSAAEGYWDGMVADDGEVVYSRFRHDCRRLRDGSVLVGGGRDYFHSRGGRRNPSVRNTLVRDHLIVNGALVLPVARP